MTSLPGTAATPGTLGRYILRERIGQGSMGLVYRAVDSVSRREVALKTLRYFEPDDLYRLKREFRALSQLSHPNLVRFYDLVVTDDHSFFTMELIAGVDFVTHVRTTSESIEDNGGRRKFDSKRLRSVLRQLVDALEAVHERGKLHRDIKPSNVLVDQNGRVVLMDFGLVSGLQSRQSRDSQIGLIVGTLAYMSPEQFRGEALTAASDWYSVGVMLYEALAGRLPFEGIFDAMLRSTPPPLPAVTGGFPDDLKELTRALLAPRVEDRPTLKRIRELLGRECVEETEAEAPRVAPIVPPAPSVSGLFVGRRSERARLIDLVSHSRDDGHTVLIEGTSGIGKTALIEHLCARVESELGALILKGRCHPQESVPFKAVDALVDELARVLSRQPPERLHALMPRHAAALARVFPVLGRIPAFAESAQRGIAGAEPHEVLRRALEGFRDLLARLADYQPIVFWVDDLQWGDLDSVDVLRALQRHPDAPRLLIVLSFRAEDRADSRVLQNLFERITEQGAEFTTNISLGPLSREETRQLAEELLAGTETGISEALLDAVVRDSGGSPFFTSELARHARTMRGREASVPDLGRVLAARFSALPDDSRRLLEVVAVAGRPIDEEVAGRTAGVGDLESALFRLRSESLLRVASSNARRVVTCYHDRIREAVVDAQDDAKRRQLHMALARTLESLPECDPQMLVDHYFLADAREHAAEHAYRSAQKAAAALAFHHAASLYRQALDLGSVACPRWQLHAHLADTLVNAGYGADAARAYLSAADGLAEIDGDRFEVLHLQRSAAEQYLRSGFVDEGNQVMRQVLRALGLRYHDNPRTALASLILNRLRFNIASRFGGRGSGAEISPLLGARMDALWSAGLGISDFDSVRAFDFQIRHALVALRAGDPAHLSRALATEAVIMAMEGGPRKMRRTTKAQVEGERLAFASGDPQAQAHSMLMSAGVAFFDHRYRDALAQCVRGEQVCRDHCIGVAWELANLQYLAVYALAYLGEIAELQERLPEMLRRARERGDHFALTNYRVGLLMLAWLAKDRPEEARRETEEASRGRVPAKSPWQFHLSVYGASHIDLYEGRPEAALERVESAWRILRSAQMLRLETVRVEQRVAHARALIACALREGDGSAVAAKQLRTAQREARKVTREPARWAPAFADTLFGGIAAARGDFLAAASHLDRAAVGFDTLGMALHATSARHEKARLPGLRNDESALAQQEAMRREGIERPERIATMLVPGVPA